MKSAGITVASDTTEERPGEYTDRTDFSLTQPYSGKLTAAYSDTDEGGRLA